MKTLIITVLLSLGALTVTATAAQVCCGGMPCCDGGPCCD